MNIFKKTCKAFYQTHSLLNIPKRTHINLNIQTTMDLRKAVEFMNQKKYVEASDVIDKVVANLKDFKGTPDYNKVLRMQAHCYSYLRQDKQTEQIFQNILEYMKYKSQNFTPQEFLNAKLDILGQYLLSSHIKAVKFIDEIKKQHFHMAPEEDQALIEYYHAIITACDIQEKGPQALDDAKKEFTQIINRYKTNIEFCFNSAHNIAVINWWQFQKSPQAEIHLSTDAFESLSEKYEKKVEEEVEEYFEKFQRSNLDPKDFSGIFKTVMFGFGLAGGKHLNSFVKVPSLKDILDKTFFLQPHHLQSVLFMSEVLLEMRQFRDTGKKLIDLVDAKTRDAQAPELPKSQVLRAAYCIDTGNFDDSMLLLRDVITREMYPWEDYNKLMASKFLGIVSEITQQDPKEIEKIKFDTGRLEKRLPKWSSKISMLQIPRPKHMIKQERKASFTEM